MDRGLWLGRGRMEEHRSTTTRGVECHHATVAARSYTSPRSAGGGGDLPGCVVAAGSIKCLRLCHHAIDTPCRCARGAVLPRRVCVGRQMQAFMWMHAGASAPSRR
jgi:hypothetical protein